MFRYLPHNMNGIFAVEKPSGVSSSKVVLQLQALFDSSDVFAKDLAEAKEKVHDQLTKGTRWLASKIANRVKKTKIKVGHGGTLDPLASGVLIIGVGTGTKKLSYYLGECTKTYETRAVLGQSTTTGDSEGEVLTRTATEHVTLEGLRRAAVKFVGKSKQTPPIFSALKLNGKPLYEYAREGLPLPQSIKARDVQVNLIEIHDDFGPDKRFGPLEVQKDSEGKTIDSMLANNPTLNDLELFYSEEFLTNPDFPESEKNTRIQPQLLDASATQADLPVFHATAEVGSGTYIRSLISDLGRAVGLSAFMVELIRVKQSDWELGKNVFSLSDFERDSRIWGPALRRVFDQGSSVDLAKEFRVLDEKIGALLEREKESTENGIEEKGSEDNKSEEKGNNESIEEKGSKENSIEELSKSDEREGVKNGSEETKEEEELIEGETAEFKRRKVSESA